MPVAITPSLQAAISQTATTLASCVDVTRTDGTIIAYTTFDQDLVIGSVTYKHAPGMNVTNESQADDLSTDNLEVQAVFNNSAVRKIDVQAGLYDFASFRKFLVDYTNPNGGILVRVAGHLGAVKLRSDGVFSVELLSGNDVASQSPIEVTAPMCRAQFGDVRCKKNLAGNDAFGDPITVTGTLTDILDSVALRSTVVFQNQSGGGSGNTNQFSRSLGGSTFGSCGATSVATASAYNCAAEWTIPDTTHIGIAGLSTHSTVATDTDVTFGIRWQPTGINRTILFAYVNGVSVVKLGAFSAGDNFKVSIESGQVKFYKNNVFLYTPPVQPSLSYPLQFGVALGNSGAQITNAYFTSATGGGLQLVDSSRTEVFRMYPMFKNDPTPYVWRVFANGTIKFTSGLNNGLTFTVKDWDPVNKAFILQRPLSYPASIGDTYSAVKGCTKLLTVCTQQYSNAINFRGEHNLIGVETLLARP